MSVNTQEVISLQRMMGHPEIILWFCFGSNVISNVFSMSHILKFHMCNIAHWMNVFVMKVLISFYSTPPAMLSHPIASHVMEVLIQTSPEDQFNKLCSSCFRGRCKQLALHSTANFVLQRVITRAVHIDMVSFVKTQRGLNM